MFLKCFLKHELLSLYLLKFKLKLTLHWVSSTVVCVLCFLQLYSHYILVVLPCCPCWFCSLVFHVVPSVIVVFDRDITTRNPSIVSEVFPNFVFLFVIFLIF
jgi:hypothetical protein